MTMVLEGEIGLDEMADVTAMVFRLHRRGSHQLVMDFSGVSHLDYRAVPALARHAEVLRANGGDLRLAGLSPYLFAILRSAGAWEAFDCFADADDARRSFDRGPTLE